MATKLEDFFVTLSAKVDPRLGGALRKVNEFFKALPGLQIAGFGLKRVFDSVTSDVAQLGDRIAKTARSFGISGEELQRLEFAAERSGVGVDALRMALSALPKRIDAARRGSKEAAQIFADAGVSVRELAQLSPAEQFKRVGDAIGKVSDDTKRTNLALRLFEESGARLIPLFKEGEAGINAFGDELESLGGLISEDTLAAAEEYQDIMTNLGMVVRGLAVQAFRALAPIIKSVTKFVIGLRKESETIIRVIGSVALAVIALTGALGLMSFVLQVKTLAAVVAATGGWTAYASAVWSVVAAKLALIAPIAAVAAAVGILALLFEDLWVFFNGGDSVIGRMIEKFSELKNSTNAVASAIGHLGEFVFGGFGVWVADALEKVLEFVAVLKNDVVKAVDTVASFFSTGAFASAGKALARITGGGPGGQQQEIVRAPTGATQNVDASLNVTVQGSADEGTVDSIRRAVREEQGRIFAEAEAALTPG